MSEERAVSDLKKETTTSILDLQLDADIKDAIKADTMELTKRQLIDLSIRILCPKLKVRILLRFRK